MIPNQPKILHVYQTRLSSDFDWDLIVLTHEEHLKELSEQWDKTDDEFESVYVGEYVPSF